MLSRAERQPAIGELNVKKPRESDEKSFGGSASRVGANTANLESAIVSKHAFSCLNYLNLKQFPDFQNFLNLKMSTFRENCLLFRNKNFMICSGIKN